MGDFVLTKLQKRKIKIFAFFVLTYEPIMIEIHSAPQNDHPNLSFVKDNYVAGKKSPRNGSKSTIFQSQILVISLYVGKRATL